jgi:transposase-like protein
MQAPKSKMSELYLKKILNSFFPYNYLLDKKISSIMCRILTTHPITIGGAGSSVELDETFLTTRKSQRGRRVRRHGRWIFGGTERGANRSFMVLVRRRRAVDLLPKIQRYVRPMTRIYTDKWRAYNRIVRLPMWLQHRRVRHNRHFVDPLTRYHTQNIERKWGEFKAQIRRIKGVHDNQLKSHVIEFLWRESFGQPREVFYNFWAHVAELYPCS